MAGRFVRASKYRHVFGRSTKKEQCYDNLRISKNAWDSNLVKANPKYLAVNIEASGGGAFAVIPIDERGKLPEQLPLFRGHTAAVLDTDWNPFNDSLIASASDDGKVFLWKVPDDFTLYVDSEDIPDVSPVARLAGHARKVGHVLFNPAAENVLASSSGDFSVKLWDVGTGSSNLQLKHPEIVQSLSWNSTGSLLATTCRDKKLRVWDVRQEKPAQEVQGHTGAKNSRVVWMGEHDRIATTGFSRMSDRQLGLWDLRSPLPVGGDFTFLDSISGVCMPFWDDGTQCLYLAGKGDGNIRYYEYQNDKFEYLSEYKSPEPQRGIAFMPKRGVDIHDNEVMRCFKTAHDTYVEPISFIVPRRAEGFQHDIYPPTVGTKPAVSASDWFGGKEGLPPKISLESVYDGNAPVEVPSNYKPPTTSTPLSPPPVTKAEPPKPAPAPAAARAPPPSVNENKASIASMASKYRDNEPEESDDDDASSFEEVPKPVERPPRKEAAPVTSPVSSAPRATPVASQAPVAKPAPAESAAPAASGVAGPTPTASQAAAGIKDYLHDIKSMLEAQSKTMNSQMDQITHLTSEVNLLKAKMNERSSSEKDERIRQLELELEEARS